MTSYHMNYAFSCNDIGITLDTITLTYLLVIKIEVNSNFKTLLQKPGRLWKLSIKTKNEWIVLSNLRYEDRCKTRIMYSEYKISNPIRKVVEEMINLIFGLKIYLAKIKPFFFFCEKLVYLK